MLLKRSRVWIPAILLLTLVVSWTALRLNAQSTAGPAIWEYATVEANVEEFQINRKLSVANICYHANSGCRWETVRVSVERWGQANDALSAATSRLGEKGWEAVSATPRTTEHRETVLLKRPRPTESSAN